MKILLAVDGSQCSDRAVEEVARRPWPVGSEIKVLTAYELPLPPTPEAWPVPTTYFEELERAASEHAGSIMERALTKLRSAKGSEANINGEIAPGPPRSLILDRAQNWNADLIIVGSHGYRAWEKFLLGSVSQSIVSHAKCSVEVVRCPTNGGAQLEPGAAKEEGR
jgi:nucleotide-binding universal stress UspA family protein